MLRLLFLILLLGLSPLVAQQYDLILKGGHVIDPGNELDGVLDVGIKDGRIVSVSENIPASQGKKAIDVAGLYVAPGLIDLHAHVYGYSGSIYPDDTALLAGTTTVVDCGGSGWRTFEDFKEKIVDRVKTRVLCFINIVGHGMLGGSYESNVDDMDPEKTAAKIKQYRDLIVGIKTAHFGGKGWTAIERAIKAGELSDTPVIIDDKIFTDTGRTTREKVLDKMRPGDMHTHTFNDRQVELVNRVTGEVQPYIWEARRRGVLFDMGHGGGSFLWPVATKALAQGFKPDTISTDLHANSIMKPQADMANCITKMMALGMGLNDAIMRSTVNPARAIHKYPELGTLGEGREADVAVFRLEDGIFPLRDSWGKKLMAAERLRCVLTLRAGELVFDEEGRGFPLWQEAGKYERIP